MPFPTYLSISIITVASISGNFLPLNNYDRMILSDLILSDIINERCVGAKKAFLGIME